MLKIFKYACLVLLLSLSGCLLKDDDVKKRAAELELESPNLLPRLPQQIDETNQQQQQQAKVELTEQVKQALEERQKALELAKQREIEAAYAQSSLSQDNETDDALSPQTTNNINNNESHIVNIAMLLPLSGKFAQSGQDLLDSAQLALFRLQGRNLRLKFYDTKGNSEQAYRMAEQAINDGADVILGPLLASSTAAVKSYINKLNRPRPMNIFAFSNTIALAQRNVFILGLNPAEQIEKILNHLLRLGENRVSAILPDDSYGHYLHENLILYARARNMPVSNVVFFPTDTTDFTPFIRQVSHFESRKFAMQQHKKSLQAQNNQRAINDLDRLTHQQTFGPLPYDLLLVGTRKDHQTRTMAAQIESLEAGGKDVIIAGLANWLDNERLANEPSLDNAIVAALPEEGQDQFAQLFEQNYGYKPQNIASLAFDAVALYVILSRNDKHAINDYQLLTNKQGFRGINGVFRLEEQGVVKRDYQLYEIDNGRFFKLTY